MQDAGEFASWGDLEGSFLRLVTYDPDHGHPHLKVKGDSGIGVCWFRVTGVTRLVRGSSKRFTDTLQADFRITLRPPTP